ncbi:hypothetical protein SOD10_38130 [Serratia plymuthica]|uniref:DUF927 domain-containing protein n=1 Tax=Serratia plymuthica S13 TaxID=1348660 RepID=S4YQ10_SERPL|nr:DUF927 domain-containing protein [Serratia plymuthica]AGP47397.1 hypothetical protein M621_23090 [Serratia plymuthica S13]KYG15142.1 hypothetical protein SOD10_38130 [Serratia plymuthica]QQT84254.1 DUF927 domain-containing protein [Serratia plymuthica]
MKNAPNVKALPLDKGEEAIIFAGSDAWKAQKAYVAAQTDDPYPPVVLDNKQLLELDSLKIVDDGRQFVRVYQAGLISGDKLLAIAAMLGRAGVANAQLYDAVTGEFKENWTPRLEGLAEEFPAPDDTEQEGLPRGFRLEVDALWFDKEKQNRDGETEIIPIRVCSPLRVMAITNDTNGGSFGRLLEWETTTGVKRQWAMPMEMLSSSGDELRRVLLCNGLTYIGTGQTQRSLLLDYIALSKPARTVVCVDRTGWHEHTYVLPDTVIGADADGVILQTSSYQTQDFKQAGDLDEWKQHIGALCAGNSRLAFAVSCALAAPLLRLVGMDGGGYHLKGESTDGKTTVMKVATSVCGGPDYWHTWRATGNALEGTASRRNDALLPLDELREVEGREAGQIAYMLANGQGKGRARTDGELRARKQWRLLFLSTGELSLAEHAEKAGERTFAGMEVRMVQIPSDTGQHGAFEALHGHADGKAFADHLCDMVGHYHGTPLRAWLNALTGDMNQMIGTAKALLKKYIAALMPANAGNQVGRVVSRFALVAVAGEMATLYGVTGWPEGEAFKAAETCLIAWMGERGHVANQEDIGVTEQIKRFFTANQYSRFATWGVADHPREMVGYRRVEKDTVTGEDSTVFYVLPAGWREICKGFDQVKAAKLCVESGCLLVGGDGKYQSSVRLPDIGRTRAYKITSNVFNI